MNQLTKAQLTIGFLAFFASVWRLLNEAMNSSDKLIYFSFVGLQLIVFVVISIILLGILEWIKVFDLKTNSILTFMVLIVISFSTSI